jgi:hypothetical protein
MSGDLRVVIPTYRRMPKQATLSFLPDEWAASATLVVDAQDASLQKLYASQLRGAEIMIHPPEIDTIAKKRAWIIERFSKPDRTSKIVMMDDDLRFAVRKSEDPTQTALVPADKSSLDAHLNLMDELLDGVAHYGWSMRQGNNNFKGVDGGFLAENGRMCYVLGYDCGLIWRMHERGDIKLGQVAYREDMDLTLQLLKRGWNNLVNYAIAADQCAGFGAKGGCSEERSIEASNEAAHELARLHPGLVKVVQKEYEGSVKREEVIVQWKKAFRSQCDDQAVKT